MGHETPADAGRAGSPSFDNTRSPLTDLKMDGMDGLAVLDAVKKKDAEIAVMIITAFVSIETAVNAIASADYASAVLDRHAPHRSSALEWRKMRERNARPEAAAEVLAGARDPRVVETKDWRIHCPGSSVRARRCAQSRKGAKVTQRRQRARP